MDPLQRFAILCSLVTGSAVASLLFISGIDPGIAVPVRWVLYFPSYGIAFLNPLVSEACGTNIVSPLLFFAGVVLTAVYWIVLVEKVPKNRGYVGLGVLFFIFLVVYGRAAFVNIIYVPLAPSLKTVVYSVKGFLEFLVGLALLYVVLGEVDSQ